MYARARKKLVGAFFIFGIIQGRNPMDPNISPEELTSKIESELQNLFNNLGEDGIKVTLPAEEYEKVVCVNGFIASGVIHLISEMVSAVSAVAVEPTTEHYDKVIPAVIEAIVHSFARVIPAVNLLEDLIRERPELAEYVTAAPDTPEGLKEKLNEYFEEIKDYQGARFDIAMAAETGMDILAPRMQLTRFFLRMKDEK